jgi:predicted lipoprotein with Yx(FWY)xxD motif
VRRRERHTAVTSNKKSAGKSTTATTAAPTTTAPPATTTTAAAAAATVKMASASIGQILVDTDGKTLYLFDRDQGTTAACTGGCTGTWPVLTAGGAVTGGAGVDASKLSSGPGGQVVYNGHLLYRYAGDTAAGQTNGNGVGGVWHAVTPAGTAA